MFEPGWAQNPSHAPMQLSPAARSWVRVALAAVAVAVVPPYPDASGAAAG